jgi:ComF family protein
MMQDLFHILFPKCCLACEQIVLENEDILCHRCREELPFTQHHLHLKNEVTAKLYGRLRIEFGACMLYFSKRGKVQQLFHNLKYRNHPEISYFLGMMYCEQLKETTLLNNISKIIPVPLHPKKQKKRGYNQVDGFAVALSETFSIPINRELLYKTRKTNSQTTQNLLQRTTKHEEIFDVKICSKEEGSHFLLIDDILTTGSTIESCGKKLLQIPNSKLSVLCLAATL